MIIRNDLDIAGPTEPPPLPDARIMDICRLRSGARYSNWLLYTYRKKHPELGDLIAQWVAHMHALTALRESHPLHKLRTHAYAEYRAKVEARDIYPLDRPFEDYLTAHPDYPLALEQRAQWVREREDRCRSPKGGSIEEKAPCPGDVNDE